MTTMELGACAAAAVLLAGVLCTAIEAEATPRTTLYVAADGSDKWSGRLLEANASRTDGPFATLERARDEIRAMKQRDGLLAGGIGVVVRGGTYERSQPFELTAEDSGTADAPIVYRALSHEEVRISGGKRVTNFEPVTDPAILGKLDEAARGNVLQADLGALGVSDFGDVAGGGLELFFQERPMTLARWPNEGFTRIVDVVGGDPYDIRGTVGDRVGKFVYDGDRPARWIDEKDPWVHGYWFWDWSDQRHKIESIDTEKRVLSVAPPYHGYGYRKGQWFYAFNMLTELDAPGEWYLDRETGVLYFWPPAPIEDGAAVVSVIPTLVTMRDTSDVTVHGLTFEAARGTAVTIAGGTGSRVACCILRNLGGSAVSVAGGEANGVVGCEIYHTGGGGISLSGGVRETLTPAKHFAENNHIHDYSRWYRMYHPAISLGGVGNRASHNLIHDAPHMGVGFSGNDHLIEFNEIHHVCMESNDAGAMYAGRNWTMRGTVIRHNYLHHISGFENRGCVGVYLDDMWCGTEISGNVFYQVTMAAFVGGGRDNVIENNIFVDCKPAVHIDARALGWAGDHVDTTMREGLLAMPYQKPPWSERYPKLVNILDDDPAAPKGNLVARNVCSGGQWDHIEEAARPLTTFEDNLVAEDPHFVDREQMNFQLRDDSPAYELGFKRIPVDKIGLYGAGRSASRPR
ncbi:MAG: right-handed parallel beta-helix repeat-containing protein [Armatimonadota bacterium]|nr:MAG: right-handed parallel beta-helix repeat-containing protein [Armatimonadota bacterium]